MGDLAVAKLGPTEGVRVRSRAAGRAGGPGFDLALASYCLNPSRAEHGIGALAEELLASGATTARSPRSPPSRVARAAHALRPLSRSRCGRTRWSGLLRARDAARRGAGRDGAGRHPDRRAVLGCWRPEFATALERLIAEIYALAGMEFNINSPPQLRTVLFERLGISPRGVRRGRPGSRPTWTCSRRLAEQHPLPAKILEYRALAKLKSTYIDALPALVDPATAASTPRSTRPWPRPCRLSSSDPNLQKHSHPQRGRAPHPRPMSRRHGSSALRRPKLRVHGAICVGRPRR